MFKETLSDIYLFERVSDCVLSNRGYQNSTLSKAGIFNSHLDRPDESGLDTVKYV